VEWATRLESTLGKLVAKVVDAKGARQVSLERLVSGGMPRVRADRMVIEQQIESWCETDSAEYRRALGLELPGIAAGDRHAVYVTQAGKCRVLTPALVLMRAFFRPTRYLLPQMFMPQALDRVRFLDTSKSPPKVEFYAATLRNLPPKHGDVKTPLLWMSAFPSAIGFAASVHRNALCGRLAVSLPSAKVRIALQGLCLQRLFLATNATLLEVEATEAPLEWAANHPRTVYRRSTFVSIGASPVLQVSGIPRRADGSVDLTDEEWRLIEPVLFPSGKPCRPLRLDPRRVLDGILRKLIDGTAWRTTNYPVGTHVNALYAYRQWNRSGALERVFAILREQRTTHAGTIARDKDAADAERLQAPPCPRGTGSAAPQ